MKFSLIRNRALPRRGRRALGMAGAAILCLAVIPSAGQAVAGTKAAPGSTVAEELPNFDARYDVPGVRRVIATREAMLNARPKAGLRALRDQLGVQGIVDMDGLTATPRRVARIDGFLTGRSKRAPARIALDYVRARPDVFGLTADEASRLTLRKDYKDIAGTHHLSFIQTVNGVPFFGNGLKAHVAKDGRLIQVDGSNVAEVPASFAAPRLSAAQAYQAAAEDVFSEAKATVARAGTDAVRTTEFSNGDKAQLVLFKTLGGVRTAWQTLSMSDGYLHVIDAESGKTLYRRNLVSEDNADVFENYPGAAAGGTRVTRTLPARWLPNNSPRLAGNVAHVWKDLNDDNLAQGNEEVRPVTRGSFIYPFTPFTPAACVPEFVCSWDPEVANSWQANANANAVQLFYFLGKFHDHLLRAPIGFTREAGNFEAVDDDAVQGHAIDGANTADGLPDGQHVDNANMNTPPDGTPPVMQMYLFHQPGTAFPTEDPFIAGNSGDEADIVYHEYTHGLSNRLVVDANGVSTLGNIQAGAMGEAWSDWYAFDLLVQEGNFTDTPADGDLRVGEYVGWGNDLIRTNPIDCPVGSTSPNCAGTPGSGPGGYTYGDFGRIIGQPEVHADGEIWAQTLWDLRKELGINLTRSLVTRAMELSPANPSFLDQRNSILQADLVVNGGKKQKKIWQIFAARGMGWFAGAVDGDDTTPVEDFSMPPNPNTPRGSLSGTVRDDQTGAALSGVVVAFGGHNSGFAENYAAVTNASGQYTIGGILPGTYPKVFARGGAGYDVAVQTLSIASRPNTANWGLRRDWAASSGGAAVVAFNGLDATPFGCGPSAMIDQSQGSGWSTDAVITPGNNAVLAEPRFMTVQLPVAVNIADLQINPSATCGDGGSASTGDFTVETSTDGTTFVVAASGHFNAGNRGRMNSVPLAAGTGSNVLFIRYTMRGTQLIESGGTPTACPPEGPGGFSACDWVDSVELAAYGSPTP
jgi:extracellular elastinolytic metalloproteinase